MERRYKRLAALGLAFRTSFIGTRYFLPITG
jgi:hypothetical protein